MHFEKKTEAVSGYRHLEQQNSRQLLQWILDEQSQVPLIVAQSIQAIELLTDAVVDHLLAGGRLFYIGAGTSGRLGVLDASECPPTFGVSPDLVQGIIAGGADALQHAVEFAEDHPEQGWQDLQQAGIQQADFVIGISASGTTPYVLAALRRCKEAGISTGAIVCNQHSPIAQISDFPVQLETGSEILTGSTRMKAGTAQKIVLTMLSTTIMIRLGRVEDNHLVHMQLSNEKLIDRGVSILMQQTGLADPAAARQLLLQYGSVKKAMEACRS